METTGLYVFGSFTTFMVILAIILNLGKKFNEDSKHTPLNKY